MVRQVTQAGTTALILAAFLYAGGVSAHGKVTMEEDSCVRRVGDSMVHLSAYQPQFEASAQYCMEIPQVGDTHLVVDLVDQALREMLRQRVKRSRSCSRDFIRMGCCAERLTWIKDCIR